jgi:glutathione S-transferase
MPYYTAIVTLLVVAFYFFLATSVAVAHGKFGVACRQRRAIPISSASTASISTPLWLCAIYLSDAAVAVLGLVWIAGRVLYFTSYRSAVEKRLPGFFIQSTACFLLFIGAVAGLVMHHWSAG